MFADDTNLFTSGSNLPDMVTTINHQIPLLVNWLRANRLSLNIDKTHIMNFGKNTKIAPESINISIGGSKLALETSTKFLGIILDSNLSWKEHISYTAKK
jgi:hypothetical protein